MKPYGESHRDMKSEAFSTTTSAGWKGRQSRKVARRRAADTPVMHQRGRAKLKQQDKKEIDETID